MSYDIFGKQAPYLANKAFDGNVFDTYRYKVEYQTSFVGSDNKIYVQHAVLQPKSVIERTMRIPSWAGLRSLLSCLSRGLRMSQMRRHLNLQEE
jgi:hypothetical protein